jgi:hypothetical protein
MENQNLNNQPLINPPEKAKSNWLNSMMFLVFGILIGILGLLVYQKYFANKSVEVNKMASSPIPTATPNPTTTPIQTVTPDPTADWIMYTDPVLGYSIKYPSNFNFIDKNPSASYISIIKPGGEMQGTDSFSHYKIFIEKSSARTINDAILQEKNKAKNLFDVNLQFTPTKTLTLGGTSAQIYYHTGFGYQQHIFVNSGNGILHIFVVFAGQDVQKQEQTEVDQILSTFKFINRSTNDETMEWKIFKNDVLTFKYPKDWVVSFGNSHAPTYPSDTIVLKSSPSSFDINLIVKKENNDLEATFLNFVKNTFGDFQPTIILKESNMIEGYIIEVGPNNSKLKITIKILSNGDKKLIATTILPDNKISIFNQILSTFKFLN